MKRKNCRKPVHSRSKLFCLWMALCIAAAGIFLWLFLSQPGLWFSWRKKTEIWDLDGDGAEETVKLDRRHLTVLHGNAQLWSSDDDWYVQDFLIGDLDGKGELEVLLLVWKRGNYGQAKPFWETQEEKKYSQHIFLYRWNQDNLQPLWMSSALRPQVASWELKDGWLEIVTPAGEETVWGWRTWGLERVDIPHKKI